MNTRNNESMKRIKGIVLVLIGTILWGVSGTVAQYLFAEKGYNAEWLVVIRLLVSGLLLLLLSTLRGNRNIFDIWASGRDRQSIIFFGIAGMLAVQYTYFAAIEAGNAATATLLQYLGPVFITVYIAVQARTWPTKRQLLAVFLALAGTALLVTSGNFQKLTVSGWAVFWGLASALALAFYTIYPVNLLKKWGTILVVGWGMLIGGVGMSFVHPPWRAAGEVSGSSITAILFVIIFGTLIAFYCYLESLKFLLPAETSLLGCAEPLSAAVLAVLWLKVTFGIAQWAGALCIIATIAILSKNEEKNSEIEKEGADTRLSV